MGSPGPVKVQGWTFRWVVKHTWPVLRHDSVNDAGFYTVKNKIANSGNEVTIGENGDQGLYTMSIWGDIVRHPLETYLRSELLGQRVIVLRLVTRVNPWEEAMLVTIDHDTPSINRCHGGRE